MDISKGSWEESSNIEMEPLEKSENSMKIEMEPSKKKLELDKETVSKNWMKSSGIRELG